MTKQVNWRCHGNWQCHGKLVAMSTLLAVAGDITRNFSSQTAGKARQLAMSRQLATSRAEIILQRMPRQLAAANEATIKLVRLLAMSKQLATSLQLAMSR
jgi:hypothetical protein